MIGRMRLWSVTKCLIWDDKAAAVDAAVADVDCRRAGD